jgi:hypothetical protein
LENNKKTAAVKIFIPPLSFLEDYTYFIIIFN